MMTRVLLYLLRLQTLLTLRARHRDLSRLLEMKVGKAAARTVDPGYSFALKSYKGLSQQRKRCFRRNLTQSSSQ
jgi:hypothetical protein